MSHNIIFQTKFGSHLYGTHGPESDTDIKGIFIASLDDIILGRDQKSINTTTGDNDSKNSFDDIDIELKELRKFIFDCLNGQTYALDMLFSPNSFWISSSEIWLDLLSHRSKLLSKNLTPYISYCRQQAGKYGLKGSRLGELISFIKFLESRDEIYLGQIIDLVKYSEYIKLVNTTNLTTNFQEQFLQVLDSKYQLNQKITDILKLLNLKKNKYGNRAELAMESQGIDWKAISHAFRCIYQLEELFTTKNIIFPLARAQELKLIKQGNLKELGCADFGQLQDRLYQQMQYVTNLDTDLLDQPDFEFWDKWLIKTYLKL